MKTVFYTFLLLLGLSVNAFPDALDTVSANKLQSYLYHHIHYPAVARENEISGRVFISFKFNRDKSISDIKVLKGIGFGCDEEVIRALKNLKDTLNFKPRVYTFSANFIVLIGGKAVKARDTLAYPAKKLKNYLFDVPVKSFMSNQVRYATDSPGVAVSPRIIHVSMQDSINIRNLKRFVEQHIHYPAVAKENNVMGRVVLFFIINNDKTLGYIKVIKGIGNGCDEEFMRVLKMAPTLYLPEQPGGYSVSLRFTMADEDNAMADNENYSHVEKLYSNLLFDAQVLGYGVKIVKHYIIDRSYVTPLFDKHPAKTKMLIINNYHSTKHKKDTLLRKTIERFDNKGRILEKHYYRGIHNLLVEDIKWKYAGKGYTRTTKSYRDKGKPYAIQISMFGNNGKEFETKWYKADENKWDVSKLDTITRTTKTVSERNGYKYNSRQIPIEYDLYVPDRQDPYVKDTYQYNKWGDKTEEITDIMDSNKGNRTTFNYYFYDKYGAWKKAVMVGSNGYETIIERKIVYR